MGSGNSRPCTNTSLGGTLYGLSGPLVHKDVPWRQGTKGLVHTEILLKFIWTNGSQMSASSGLHPYQSIECSSPGLIGNVPNTVSESTVSFGPHRVPGGELSEFLSAYYLCAKANSPSFP